MSTGLEKEAPSCHFCSAQEHEATLAPAPTGRLMCTDAAACWERVGRRREEEAGEERR